jgi:uncharacterized membrane protein YoaK (UPF0700 family)
VPLDPPTRFFGLAAPLAVAMGLQNAMRMDVKGANLATTYVTGTLHVAAQALARATLLAVAARQARLEAPVACSGRARFRVAPRGEAAALRTEARRGAGVGATALTVWAGFLVGALAGGALFARAGLAALLLPLVLLLVLVMDTLSHPRP